MAIRRLYCLIAISPTDTEEYSKAGVRSRVATPVKSFRHSKQAFYWSYRLNRSASHPPLLCCQWDEPERQPVKLELSGRADYYYILYVATGSAKFIENHVFLRSMVIFSNVLSPKHTIYVSCIHT